MVEGALSSVRCMCGLSHLRVDLNLGPSKGSHKNRKDLRRRQPAVGERHRLVTLFVASRQSTSLKDLGSRDEIT